MPLAVVIILLVIGSFVFHFLSPWTFTELASNWEMVDFTIDVTFVVTSFVFAAVNLFMAYCIIKFRYKKNARANYEPENKKLEYWLTGLTTIGIVAMLAPGLFVWDKFVDVPEDAHIVEAVGQQWHWTYRYPGEDGKLGEVDAERISKENPFGIDPEDPNGQDDIIVYNPEAHIPIDQPVKFLLRSKDVLHNFTIAQFRVKMDMVPGMTTFMWLQPTRTGRFELLCEELCGVGHFAMRGAVVVDEQKDFDSWLSKQPTFSEVMAKSKGNAVLGAARYAPCAACHGVQGEGNQNLNAPNLAGQSDWYLKRQLMNYKTGLRGTHKKDMYGMQMVAMAATLVNEAAVDDVVEHINTFPEGPTQSTINGNIERGKQRYATCAYCHGRDGMGLQATNAPRIAGLSDWYMKRQLQNWKEGIRGAHKQDYYGYQMGLFSQTLNSDQAIDDIIAYINTL
ncbi:MAG: cytochrome-c oxidase [Gammaproteobacteria bacterium]|nr:cytochrome-c oxidase [Gammaproteobacteria bacterium]|tara:strand:+ start:2443 stop:3795 length:1353 start_codon:yes stop_codon:yes gene_type:complete